MLPGVNQGTNLGPAEAAPVRMPGSVDCKTSTCAVCLCSMTPDDTEMQDVADEACLRSPTKVCSEAEPLNAPQCLRVRLSSVLQQEQVATCINGTCRLSACGHTFHEKCILSWFQHSVGAIEAPRPDPQSNVSIGSCPICRCAVTIPMEPNKSWLTRQAAGTAPAESAPLGHATEQVVGAGRYQWKANRGSTCVFRCFTLTFFVIVLIFSVRGTIAE